MDIPCSPTEASLIEHLAAAAAEAGVKAWLIGGFVRDRLLGRPCADMDIVCLGDGIDLAHRMADRFRPTPQVAFFKNFGTAHIHVQGYDIEFVGARKESYQRGSRNPDVEPGTLQDDLQRRDFTVNALHLGLNANDHGRLHDPFEGLKDLRDGILRTPLSPDTAFSDDPLRMLRAIRFTAQLGFTIHPATWDGIVRNRDRIRIVSQERITEELNKMLLCPKPSVGFDILYRTGLLRLVFPQMTELAGAETRDGQGHKDNLYHTLQVLDNIAPNTDDPWLRWAALLHDIGKPATKRFEAGTGWTFHGHEVVGGRMVPRIFTQLKLPQDHKMRFVRKLVELHLRPISLTQENITDSAIRRLLFDAGEDLEALMTLCEADITSKNKAKVRRFLANFEMVRERLREVEEKDQLRNWQPPVTGEMIMATFGLPPSRPVGEIKTAIREAILDGIIPNDPRAAWDYMLQKASDMGIQPLHTDAAPGPTPPKTP